MPFLKSYFSSYVFLEVPSSVWDSQARVSHPYTSLKKLNIPVCCNTCAYALCKMPDYEGLVSLCFLQLALQSEHSCSGLDSSSAYGGEGPTYFGVYRLVVQEKESESVSATSSFKNN